MPQSKRTWNAIALFLACWLLAGVIGISILSAQEKSPAIATSPDATTLQPGAKPLERILKGGEKQAYRLHVDVGMFVHFVVEQLGIDVALSLYAPDGKLIGAMDSPNGSTGLEQISTIADAGGDYRLEVSSEDKTAKTGRYRVTVGPLRTPKEEDERRITAEPIFFDAIGLMGHGDADSIRSALRKSLDVLPLWRAANDGYEEAMTLNFIGNCYVALGERQKALEYFSQASHLERAGEDRSLEAVTLNSIGLLYYALGDNRKALEYYDQTLRLQQAIEDKSGEAATLNNLGVSYSALGEKQKALDYFSKALPLSRTVADRSVQPTTLINIGGLYSDLGEKQKALKYFNEALTIGRAISHGPTQVVALIGLGNVYSGLDEKQKALEYFNQALSMEHAAADRTGEAAVLNNIGNLYLGLGEKQKAIEYFNQTLPLERADANRYGEAITLSNIGSAYFSLRETQRALGYFNQALSLQRAIADRSGEAATLGNIGSVYSGLGEKQKAIEFFKQALPLRRAIGDRTGEAATLVDMASSVSDSHPDLAILFGKQAINMLQSIRRDNKGLQEAQRTSYETAIGFYYRGLANLLIKQGRLSEAQQVLDLLKNQEYKDYVRGETSDTLSPLSLTPAERSAAEDYQRSTAKVVERGRRWDELKQNRARTPAEDKEFQQLSDSLGNASQLMNEYFARLYKLFAAGGDANRQVANITDETASLKQQIAKMPHTVALYTVVSEGRYSVIVITGQTMVAREYVIADKDLYQKVAAFRQIILDPSKDPKPLAQELYKILIAPIKSDLDQAKAETLIWSLDGVLRYVPFAALYDGQHYLIENYSLASFTPVSIAHISDKPNLAAVNAAGMGISGKFDEKLKPLPEVETELDSIVQDPQVKGSTGVMHGTILLNAKFTELAMEKQLDGQHAVVHIASHFVMRPGDDSQSYLLMAGKDGDGAGYHMTVASFRDNQKMSLEGTELLTLSACDTGIGGSSANGREVDGLATTAQRKGAKSVISSLWQINDNSTADLMADFYKRWIDGGGKVTKVEALRQAQLDLLLGKVTAKPDSSNPNAGTSYAQPYYWAPFVLMGNWQ